MIKPAAAEDLKKWDSGPAPREKVGAGPILVTGSRSAITENFRKYLQICAIWCMLAIVGVKICILNNSVFNVDFGRSI